MRRSAALALALVVTLASGTGHAKKKRVVVDRIVAVVDESAITKSALDREVRLYRKQIERAHALDADARTAAVRDLERRLLREMIDARLLSKAAERARVSVSKEEIEKGIAEVAKQNNRTVAELWQLVASEGFDEVDYRRRIAEQIVHARLATYEAQKQNPDLGKRGSDEQRRIVSETMKTLVSQLRSAAHIEERL